MRVTLFETKRVFSVRSSLFGNMEDADLHMPGNVSLALSPATNDLANVQNMTLQNAVQSFTQNIDKLKAGGQFDVCIIDTPPSLGNTLAAALAWGLCVMSDRVGNIQPTRN